MRKWMRERLQGRKKKKASEPADQPAPPPLQPAYFDPEESPAPAGGDAPRRSKAPDRSEPDVESAQGAPNRRLRRAQRRKRNLVQQRRPGVPVDVADVVAADEVLVVASRP